MTNLAIRLDPGFRPSPERLWAEAHRYWVPVFAGMTNLAIRFILWGTGVGEDITAELLPSSALRSYE